MPTPTIPTCDYLLPDGSACTNIATQRCNCGDVVCIKHWVPRVHGVINGKLQEGPGRCQTCADKFYESMKKTEWVENVRTIGSILKGLFGG